MLPGSRTAFGQVLRRFESPGVGLLARRRSLRGRFRARLLVGLLRRCLPVGLLRGWLALGRGLLPGPVALHSASLAELLDRRLVRFGFSIPRSGLLTPGLLVPGAGLALSALLVLSLLALPLLALLRKLVGSLRPAGVTLRVAGLAAVREAVGTPAWRLLIVAVIPRGDDSLLAFQSLFHVLFDLLGVARIVLVSTASVPARLLSAALSVLVVGHQCSPTGITRPEFLIGAG